MYQSAKSATGVTAFLFAALVVAAAVAALRVPFLSNVLIGEEGTIAYLVLGPQPVIHGLDAAFAARIDGVDRLIFPEHNILMYEFLDIVGRGLGRLLPLCRDGSMDCTTVEARAPFLVLFMLGLATAMVAIRTWLALDRPLTLAIQLLVLFYVTSAPVVVGGSIQPQIDGGLGVLVVAAAAAFLLASDTPRRPAHLVWASFGGIALVVGKNEWALALAAAVSVVLVLAVVFSFDVRSRRWNFAAAPTFRICGIILIGVAAGQMLNYLYAPDAYTATFGVMQRIDAMKLNALEQLRRTSGLSYPIFLTCGVVLALIALRLKHYCLRHPVIVIVAGWGATIAVAYAYSGFSGDGFQRYYAPAGVLACIALICVIRDLHLPRLLAAGAALVLVAGIGLNGASLADSYRRGLSISSAPGVGLERVKNRYIALGRAYNGVAIIEQSPIGIYYRNVDWVSADLGDEGAVRFVRQIRPDASTDFLRLPF